MNRAFHVGDVVVIDYGETVSDDLRVAKLLANGNVRLEGMAGKGQWRQDGSAAGGPFSRACLRHARDPEVARLRERARVVALWLDVEVLFGRARREAMRGALPWDDANRILLLLRQVVGTPVAAPDPEE